MGQIDFWYVNEPTSKKDRHPTPEATPSYVSHVLDAYRRTRVAKPSVVDRKDGRERPPEP